MGKTPPKDVFPESVELEDQQILQLSDKILTITEFIEKLKAAPKDGRLVIVFNGENGPSFPDEAVHNIVNREGNLTLLSGYYDDDYINQIDVVTPEILNFNALADAKLCGVQVDTKRYGNLPVTDVISFHEEFTDYDWVLIICKNPIRLI